MKNIIKKYYYLINCFTAIILLITIINFNTLGTVCTERAKLITDFCKEHGFLKEDGNNWNPELRQGKILNHILSNKKPIIFTNIILPFLGLINKL